MLSEFDGIALNYDRRGEGSPVLILHGWGASIEAVRPIANCMVELGFEAVSLDFPGFGQSPEPGEPWGVPEYAKAVRAFIGAQSLEGCDVICHSFGGRVTLYLASEEPGLFNRLVLIDAAGVKPKRGVKYYARVYAYKLGKALSRVGVFDRAFHLSEKRKNAGSADYRALQSDVMRATLVKAVNLDLTDRLERIENETLLVWGSDDAATPMYMADIIAARIKNAGLAVLKGAGHYSYLDRSAQFAAVMRAFFLHRG